jgi:hypothetical protein
MTSAPQAPDRPAIHWLSVGQFGLSLLATAVFWSMAGSTALAGLVALIDPALLGGGEALSLFLLAAGIAFIGLLLVPSAYFAFLRLIGRRRTIPLFKRPGWLPAGVLIVLFPLVILAGYWVYQNEVLAWLFLPALHVLAVLLPIWWLATVGTHGLPSGSPQRAWGVLGSGLALGPFLIFMLEMMAFLFLAVAGAIYLSMRPDLSQELLNLVPRLSDSTQSPEAVLEVMRPYLLQPAVVLGVFIFGAVLTPLIEELLKPVGVWLLALTGAGLTPGAGFAAGLLSGAGFALFESLAYTSNAEDWTFAVVARIGTAVMHIMTTGLVGWAIAVAWRQRQYLRLVGAYLAAVLLHGLWNGIALLNVGYTLAPEALDTASILFHVASTAPLFLGFLTITMFILLLWSNYQLRKSAEKIQPEPKSVL